MVEVATIDEADAIVVLSGMIRAIETKVGFKYELTEASDRILAGVELLKEKRAPVLVLTQGKLPWSMGLSEGEYLRTLAIRLGVPKTRIVLTELVQNTDQEAKAVKKIFPTRDSRVILVTSAYHMPRAIKVFEAAGLNVTPFAVDFLNGASSVTIMDFIPAVSALSDNSFFFREMLGRFFYRLKY